MTRAQHGCNAMHVGDRPQGVAGDCNSLAETHAWFDSRVAHHLHHTFEILVKVG